MMIVIGGEVRTPGNAEEKLKEGKRAFYEEFVLKKIEKGRKENKSKESLFENCFILLHHKKRNSVLNFYGYCYLNSIAIITSQCYIYFLLLLLFFLLMPVNWTVLDFLNYFQYNNSLFLFSSLVSFSLGVNSTLIT